MLILLLLISTAMLVCGFMRKNRHKSSSNEFNSLIFAGTISTIFVGAAILFVGMLYSGIITIDERINLYETENTKIEQRVEFAIESYKEYESDTLKEFDFGENMDIVIAHYPELKTNELVKDQIDIYVKNNQKIKELKEAKLDYTIEGWWLFFNIGVNYK